MFSMRCPDDIKAMIEIQPRVFSKTSRDSCCINAFLFFSLLIQGAYFNFIKLILYETSQKNKSHTQVVRFRKRPGRPIGPSRLIQRTSKIEIWLTKQSRTFKDRWGGASYCWNMVFEMSYNCRMKKIPTWTGIQLLWYLNTEEKRACSFFRHDPTPKNIIFLWTPIISNHLTMILSFPYTL